MKQILVFLLLSELLIGFCLAQDQPRRKLSSNTFSVLDYGAKANGVKDDTKAFMDAWKAACSAAGDIKFLIPSQRVYLVGPLEFHGPCKSAKSMTVHLKGYLKATTDLNMYSKGDVWVQFAWVDRLTLTGGGTFDGQGAASWPYNKCPQTKQCKVLPSSIKFVYTTNTRVSSIKSVNSKFFHFVLLGCKNFRASDLRITAPADSPNTDGLHMERCSDVRIYSSIIGTGDDCISVGQGNDDVLISGITCGPGHGISVGSLGRYPEEGDVRGLVIKDSTFTDTQNGLRIKTWENSPSSSVATNMTFKNIIMYDAGNPIIIDQTYCPYTSCSRKVASKVKLSDIHFQDIRGTSKSEVAVTLRCSPGTPCKNVNLNNINLKYKGKNSVTAVCSNVKAKYTGKQLPHPCS